MPPPISAAAPQNDRASLPRDLYLDLMKRILVNTIYGDAENVPCNPQSAAERKVVEMAAKLDLVVMQSRKIDLAGRVEGREWPQPQHVHSMMGRKRLDNLQFCVEDVLRHSVPGDLIETGVWRGGGTIFMRAILKAYGISDRTVWVADSFRGLPPPDPKKYPADSGDTHHTMPVLSVSLEQVKAHFDKYGLLDDRVRFLEGWFSETLPTAPIDQLALMRLDGDMYESTMDALEALYPKLSPGGYVVVDDYGYLESCRQAVSDYRGRHGINDEIHTVDWTGVYWRRSR